MNVGINHPTGQPNFTEVEVDGTTLWFSYTTLVAFQRAGNRYVRENVWGPTTGKHLNEIDGGARSRRLSEAAFIAAWEGR